MSPILYVLMTIIMYQDLRRPLFPYNTEVDEMFRYACKITSLNTCFNHINFHSQVDKVFPVHANPTDFFLQLFSSTFLNEKDGSLHFLYQFILHRARLNAGGKLLPELVQFYRWIHNELNYTVTFDDAKSNKVTVKKMLDLYLERHYLGEEKERIVGMFESVAGIYISKSSLPESMQTSMWCWAFSTL